MKAAMNEGLARRGAPSVQLEHLYRRWAGSGCGLLVTGNVVVDARHLSEPGNVVIEDSSHHRRLAGWASAAQAGGAKVWVQLNHPGRQANPVASIGQPVAPSAVGVAIRGARTPRAMTSTEVTDAIDRFATAAGVAVEAGFDGVQLHAAHGFLISQFLSPLSNRREDEWGGDAERRMAFLLAVTRAVRHAIGDRRALSIKLNSADFQRGGFDEHASQAVIGRLAGEAIDLIEISGGTFEAPAMIQGPRRQSTQAREAYFLEYAGRARTSAKKTPLAVTGGFRSAAAIDRAITEGACEVVGLARPLCLEPTGGRLLLTESSARLPDGTIRMPGASLLRPLGDARALRAALDVQWHTDQIHSMAAGSEPRPRRSGWRTLLSTARRTITGALTRPR